jgi:hypothetical protein
MGVRAVLSLALLLSAVAAILAGSSSASAQEGDGHAGQTYTDSVYGFTVTWDPDLWTVEEIAGDDGVPYGVYLYTDDITASIAAAGYGDPEECLEDRAAQLENYEGVSRFRESRRVDPLEFEREVVGAVYQYSWADSSSGETDTWATYYGCEPLVIDGEAQPDVVLTHEYSTLLDQFEDLSAEWVALVNEVTFAGQTDTRDDEAGDSGASGVNGNRYLDATDGWAVTWDEAALTGENWVPADGGGVEGVSLTSESGAFMTIFADDGTSIRRCVTGQVDAIEGDVFTALQESEVEELPQTSDDARAALYDGTFVSSDGEESPIFLYVECRPLIVGGEEVEDRFLVVNLISSADVWADEVAMWSDVLRAIEFDAASATDGEPTPSDEDTGSGIDGDTYTSAIGYRVTWDDSIYIGELLDETNPDLGLTLSSDSSFMQFQVAGDPDADACVDAEAGIVEELSGMGRLSRSREESPESGRESASELYGATLTFDEGSESEVIIYIECRPLGNAEETPIFLVVRMVGLAASYEDELPQWQSILDSIETTEPGAEG